MAILYVHNIYWNTNMYVHSPQAHRVERVMRLGEGKIGLDRVCYGTAAALTHSATARTHLAAAETYSTVTDLARLRG